MNFIVVQQPHCI